MSEQSYYIVIPAKIIDDFKVSHQAILLYGLIASLVSKEGYCWASNSYLGQKLHTERSYISKLSSQLEKAGYIKIERTKDTIIDGTPVGNRKRIWLTEALVSKTPKLVSKEHTPDVKNTQALVNIAGVTSGRVLKNRVLKNSNNPPTPLKADSPQEVEAERMLSAFEEALGVQLARSVGERRAAKALIRRVGTDMIMKALPVAAAASADRYGPTISSMTALNEKWNNLLIYARKRQQSIPKGAKIR